MFLSLGRKTAAVIATAVVLRLAAMLILPTSMLRDCKADPDAYAQFAHTFATSGVYGPSPNQHSAFRAPVYPILITPFCLGDSPFVWGIAALHLSAAALTVWATIRFSLALGARRTATIAGLVVACDPLLIKQSTEIMTETVSVLLFVSLCWIWSTRVDESMRRGAAPWMWCVFTGVLIAFNVMTRPAVWAFWLLTAMFVFWRKSMTGWLIATVVALGCCLPWIIRNSRVMGTPILTTTHGGYTLWLGQNPVFFRDVVAADLRIWPEESFKDWTNKNLEDAGDRSEIERDRMYQDKAWDWMHAHQAEHARTVLHHLASFWSPTPSYGGSVVRWVCGVWYILLFLAAALALAKSRTWWTSECVLPAALIAFTIVHALYWSDVRMRAPLIPILGVLAALALNRLNTDRAEAPSADAPDELA